MSENAASAYIAALKAKLQIDSDDRLSKAIGVGKSTLASWRKRGDIPKKSREMLSFDFGLDYDLVTNNSDGVNKTNQRQIKTAVYLSLMRLAAEIPSDNHVEFASWLARYDYRVRNMILEHFERDDIVRAKPHEFTELLMRVARGEHGTPAQIVALKSASDREEEEGTYFGFPT